MAEGLPAGAVVNLRTPVLWSGRNGGFGDAKNLDRPGMPEMKQTLKIATRARIEMVDITADVQKTVDRQGITEGLCVVCVPHTTAGVTINENADPDVQDDILGHLTSLVPRRDAFRHGEGNSDAHIKVSLTGSSETVIVERGRLVLGTWQSIFFCEFDGPRKRKCHVTVLGR